MSKVKMGFSRLAVPDQVERSRHIQAEMTGNVNYTTPSPALSVVGTATDALETAYNESRGGDEDKLAVMRLRRKDLLALIVLLASYVQTASESDEEKILSSGFDVVAPRTPHPDTAGVVNNVRLKDGSVSGKMKVAWDIASDSVIYVIEASLTADFAINEFKGCTTKTHKEIGGFTPETTYWIRVFAFGRENPGQPSSPVSLRVR